MGKNKENKFKKSQKKRNKRVNVGKTISREKTNQRGVKGGGSANKLGLTKVTFCTM